MAELLAHNRRSNCTLRRTKMTLGEKKGLAAGTVLGLAIGLMIALFIAMRPELFRSLIL